jgi:hypothetical protein
MRRFLSPDSTKLLITGKAEIAPGVRYAYGFEDARDAGGNGSVGHGGGAPGMNGDLRVNGHRFLPSGGHRTSPLADMFSPRWWPSVLPASGSAPVVAEPSP